MQQIVAKEKEELGADYATSRPAANESISAPLVAKRKQNTTSVAPAPAAAPVSESPDGRTVELVAPVIPATVDELGSPQSPKKLDGE